MPTKTTKTKTATDAAAKGPYVYACGKRKTAVARVKLFKGTGQVSVNGRDLKEYFTVDQYLAAFFAPFGVASLSKKDYDIEISVFGGGVSAQAEACRHGIAQALESEDGTRRVPLKQAGFLRRDSRAKERKKPGLKGARRSPQWAKR